MLSVAVTGAGGFVGREVCMRLANGGLEVRAVVRDRPAPLHPRVRELKVADLHDPASHESAFAGANAVVHLAARVHRFDAGRADAEHAYRSENVELTSQLAHAAARHGVRRFVFLSSIKAVGESSSGTPLGPDVEPKPLDPYGRSKLAAERALAEIAAACGIEVVVVRPPLVYGPGVGANFRRIVEWVARGVPLPFGSVTNRRSLVSVWNLADLVVRAVVHPAAAGQTLHVCDERAISTQELVRLIASGLDRRPALLPIPPSLMIVALRVLGRGAIADRLFGDLEVDASGTCRILQWSPPIGVEEGVVRAVREMRL